MTFVYPLLLGGLVLVGVPVLLHLIMRQKPKHLLFPAVRFLLERRQATQRKLQLRHLLLLAMRMFLIAAICLALARPKLFSERFHIDTDRPVAAVLLFDTSPSMEYKAGGISRLDLAKTRGNEVLDELPSGSRVAIVDTAVPGGEWLPSLSQARERIAKLEMRASNQPVTNALPAAYELLARLEEEYGNAEELPARFLYVFSDRTEACWEANQLDNLRRLRDRFSPPGVFSLFLDVGIDTPANVAISKLDLPRQVVAANQEILIQATIQALGTNCDTEVLCSVDGQEPAERKPVKLEAGQSVVVTFARRGLSLGWHQARVSMASGDALPSSSVRYATFEVRGPRKVLVISDRVDSAGILALALRDLGDFDCDVRATQEAFTQGLGPGDLAPYQAVCLMDVASPSANLWEGLERYVARGGGLAIVPDGADLDRKAYNEGPAQKLMPGRLVQPVTTPPAHGVPWREETYRHPVMAPFKQWQVNENVNFLRPGFEPTAFFYWRVDAPPEAVIVRYDDEKGSPALLESAGARINAKGRVLLFTTPLDDDHVHPAAGRRGRSNDYLKNWFYLALVAKTFGYLAGDAAEKVLNFPCGQAVLVPLPAAPRFPSYTLDGPALSSGEETVSRNEDQAEVRITQAVAPGNYRLGTSGGKLAAAFSLNIPSEECQLARVPPEKIEALFGPGSLIPLDQKSSLHSALADRWNQPLELLPGLMIVLLLAMVVENLLANKFYRQEAPAMEGSRAEQD